MKKTIILLLSLIIISACNRVTNDPDTTTQQTVKVDESKIISLLENNYLYSSLAYGALSDEEVTITDEDKTYYYINNEKITSLEDLDNLLKTIYISEMVEAYANVLFNNKRFLMFGNWLYGYTEVEPCDIGNNYDFTNFSYNSETQESFQLEFNEKAYYVYVENDKYFLRDNIFKCLE